MNFEDAMDQVKPPVRPEQEWQAPKGWEPGISWSNEKGEGEIVTGPMTEEPDKALWDRIIADFGLSADELEIVDGSISLIGWESPIQGATAESEQQTIKLTRYKVRLRRKVVTDDEATRIDVEQLCSMAQILPEVPHPIHFVNGELAMVVPCSDWQMGKGEGGGSPETFNRITASMQATVVRIIELQALGRGPEVVYLVGMGDLVEQCTGHYPAQQFTVDLNRREQMRVVRRLIQRFVDMLIELGVRVVLGAVPGNHGENRLDGKAFTTVDDNDDLAVFEQVAEVLDGNPDRYHSVSTYLADDYSYTLDVAGVPVGFFHGHVTKGGATPQQKIENWWTGQVMGLRDTVRDAKILVTAHYHHFTVTEKTGRTHIQTPAMDGGSHWWTSLTGQSSPPGIATFMVGKDYGERGYGDLLIV